ncbi:MAG: nuclear transport factor 2 family protein [Desulfobacteraceae bacterium]
MSKSQSRSGDQPNTGRRSFMWRTGAALSAILATAVPAISMPKISKDKGLKSEVDRLTGRLGSLEDENKIRELHRTFEIDLDKGNYESLVKLFSSDGEVIFNGGLFKGKKSGIQRIFCNNFNSGRTGKRVKPAPGFEINNELMQDRVEVSKDRRTAKAQFSYSIQVGTPVISDSVLFKMARLQGDGVMKWWEGGIYKVSYIKNMKDGTWKIKKLECHTLVKADYKPGRAYAKPIDIPVFSKVYPEDPAGPDKLLKQVKESKKA